MIKILYFSLFKLIIHVFLLIQFNLTIKTESKKNWIQKKNQMEKTDFGKI